MPRRKKNEDKQLKPQELPTNVELKKLLDMTVTRLENWKLEVETNPNPRMVHVLKNIIAQIETLTELTEAKVGYSYKALSRQMSILVDEVAKLNIAITDSLLEDDLIDESEEERINESLKQVFQAAVHLIRIVQQAFMLRRSKKTLPEMDQENR
jgi:K+ transporter